MCRLAVVSPVVWNIRIDKLIMHLEREDFEQYEASSVKYRDVDVTKVVGFSHKFVEEILHELFEIELLVGLRCGHAISMLQNLKIKAQKEQNNIALQALLCDDNNYDDKTLGSLVALPMLVRVKVADFLEK